ncbi:RNA polymerase sigma factor [Chitinophaga sp. CF418]|uniref:RNA polymerase sigma factor n=1 Tax=Chitinophaga sp. CF418 TaxID=1855287 RepID=UPI0009233C0E|nr:sigma-70 family RNA polymerase sigma factor [Chitinophaga sp. CF418]SHN45228.1 RNA polymerase sigma-70 factor, ECF subfamily [Chitinophaga sp. CF418]
MHDDLYTEKAMLTRIADGDERAFAQFFKAISPGISNVVRKVVKQEDAVHEVLQEFFIKLWLHRDKLPAVEQLKAYLKRMALNECFTWLNRQALLQQRLADIRSAGLTTVNETEAGLSYRETQRIIATAVSALPTQRRQIYEMSRQEGLNATEIANTLQLSPSYVRNTISAALQFIREQLKQAGKL